MTPDQSVILNKIENMMNCLDRINSKKPLTKEILENNFDTQDVVNLNLQRLIQTSVDLGGYILSLRNIKSPDTMADIFEILKNEKIVSSQVVDQLKKSVGLRNIVVHEYDDINYQVVADVVNHHLDTFTKYIQEISEYFQIAGAR